MNDQLFSEMLEARAVVSSALKQLDRIINTLVSEKTKKTTEKPEADDKE